MYRGDLFICFHAFKLRKYRLYLPTEIVILIPQVNYGPPLISSNFTFGIKTTRITYILLFSVMWYIEFLKCQD